MTRLDGLLRLSCSRSGANRGKATIGGYQAGMTIYLFLACVLVFSSVVQGVLGFGFGMLSMSFFLIQFPMQEAVPLVTGYALLVNIYLLYKLRDSLVAGHLWPILAGGLCGVPVGVMLLKQVDEGPMLLTLAFVITLHVVWSARAAEPTKLDPGRGWAGLAGLVSGALGASLGTAGPPLVIYGSTKPWNKDQLRAVLYAFFLVCCIVQMILYCATGLMSMRLAGYLAFLAPAVALGGLIGMRISSRIPQQAFRKLVLAGLFLAGLAFLRRGLVAMDLL